MGIKFADHAGLQQFLNTESVATLAVPVDKAGTLHIATMNYLHLENPLSFYFMTSSKSEKCQLLNIQPSVIAACNVGTYKGTPFTVQMRGTARLLNKTEQADVLDAYYRKRETNNKNVEGPDSVLLAFTPSWARFTDFSKGWDTTMLELI
jgi:uncharacterized protein YhbP (UPF0306 family)